MKLRICGGKYKRTQISIPDALSGFRPTKNIVREAVCNILQDRINNADVLELCAGSCLFSMEMISRGAAKAVAVERNKDLCAFVKKQIAAADYQWKDKLNVLCEDVAVFAERTAQKFDIIYFDPPYYEDELSALAIKLSAMCKDDGGVVVFEFASGDRFVEKHYADYGLRRYGKSSVLFIEKE